eukprot:5131019-Ditylum_brightwellii.AAC.1
MAHLQQHKIYMNPTEIKQVEAIVVGFFVFSHIKYHSRKDAAAELITRAFIESFNLHVHTVCHMKQRHTRAITISCGKSEVRSVQSELYQMNNQSSDEKAPFFHTQHWIFVPFKSEGTITEQHLAMKIRKHYAFLRDETAISVTGLHDIHAIITVPGTQHQVSFNRWLLTIKTADKSMLLFDAVEKDPTEVYYFATKKRLREEAE